MSSDYLIQKTTEWLENRKVSDVVIGYSGGVDSATTCAVLGRCPVHVHLVVAESPNQSYSSPMAGKWGADKFLESINLKATVKVVKYSHLFEDSAANEAAAPIIRVASFYGASAALREKGAKALVVGTTNFDESAYLGFWGKASDGAHDFYPISHLNKNEVNALGKSLGVPNEILMAIPSGDLLFQRTNDFEMIGATYNQISEISVSVENNCSDFELENLFKSVSNPVRFYPQIINNHFKYELPFSGFHLDTRLEIFRLKHYPRIIDLAKRLRGIL